MSEAAIVALLVAVVTIIPTTIASIVAAVQARRAAAQGRMNEELMNTGSGQTIGHAIARMEDQLWRHEDRLDAIEVQVREGIVELHERFDEPRGGTDA